MVIDKLAEACGVDPKHIELNDIGIYTLTVYAGAACTPIKVPVMREGDDVDTAQLPSEGMIATYVMGEMMANLRIGRWSRNV